MSLEKSALQLTMEASLAFFKSQKNYRYNGIFMVPVDPNIFPMYSNFVHTSMDLTTMQKKMDNREYDVGDEGAKFWQEVRMIVDNCQAYNSRPLGVDRLTQKDFNYVTRVINGFRKLMVAEKERFNKRLQKEREKVATFVPVHTSRTANFKINLSPNANRGGGGSSVSPPNPNRLKLSLNLNKSTTRKPAYTPVPFTSSVRSRCLKMFSLIRRVHDPGLEPMKKSCRSRKDYAIKIDWMGPDGMKEVEAKCRLTGSEEIIKQYKKGNFTVSPSDVPDVRYKYLHEVIMDARRGVSNKVRVMCGEEKDDRENRDVHCDSLVVLESYFAKFLGVPGEDYPALMEDWRTAIETINQAFTLNVQHGGHVVNASEWFRHPVTSYFGGVWPHDYLDRVARPVDFGTITTMVLRGEIQSLKEFRRLCNLIFTNCESYYAGKPEAVQYVPLARVLKDKLPEIIQRAGLILKMNKRGGELKFDPDVGDREGEYIITRLPLKHLLESLCNDTFDDPGTRKTHKTMDLFERPYEEDEFPGYDSIIELPICLRDVRNRVSRDGYRTPEDFEDDVLRIFDNCIQYSGHHYNPLYNKYAESGQKAFRKVYNAWAKKIKNRDSNHVTVISGPKRALALSALSALAAPSQPSGGYDPSLATLGSPERGIPGIPGLPNSSISPNPLGGVEGAMDINDIAEAIKRSYDGQLRDETYLAPWEVKCWEFYKEIRKHEWLSGKKYTKPPLFFSVPVISMWTDPIFVKSYLSKVARPMDLTTLQCRFLKGGEIKSVPHFLNEIMLIFDNCILANQDGMREGLTDSVAYYKAGKLLLDFVRYVSIRFFDEGDGGSEGKGTGIILYNDVAGAAVDPNRTRWKWDFSEASKRAIMQEMDSKFLHEDPDISGWVSTQRDRRELKEWPEREVMKVIKILKSNKYQKDMQMFKAPRYPNNYDIYVERRCDLFIVDEKLSRREYTSYKDIVTDLRLIFANAITYNVNFKDTDPASMFVYEAAQRMQPILEARLKDLRIAAVEQKARRDIEVKYEKMNKRDKDAVKMAAKVEAEEAKFTKPADKTAKLIEIVQNHELGQAPAESQEGMERKKELEALKRKLIEKAKEDERKRVEEEVRAIKEAEQKAKEEGVKMNLPKVIRRREVDFSMLQDTEAEIEAKEIEEAKRRELHRKVRDDVYQEWLQKRKAGLQQVAEGQKYFVDFLVSSGGVKIDSKDSADGVEAMDIEGDNGDEVSPVRVATKKKPFAKFNLTKKEGKGGEKRKILAHAVW